jgi:betaine-aldehyde dehydrogenase
MIELGRQDLYIDGRHTAAIEGRTFTNFSPSTAEELCEVQIADSIDVDRAVQAAEKGFRKWSSMTATQRGRILMNAVRIIRERVTELAHLEVLDTGKPITEALATDIHSGADAIEYFAGIAATMHGHHTDLGSAFAYTRREPLGVCAGIGAWNYPFQIACWKSAPALACGNSMIFKPSELTPLTALKLAEIYTEAGLPDGVFNVVQGKGETGAHLSKHPGVRKISLTGSVATGKNIMKAASETLKHVTLELGGKSPLIVFEDSKLDQAVSASLVANFYTQGEICSNGTRVFLEEGIYDEFIEKLLVRVKKIKIGDPFDPATQMGSLISGPHLEKVLKYIELGKKEGASLLCGGTVPVWNSDTAKFRRGHFILPAVFANCTDSMTIAQEEIFGPVMTVLRFKSEEEVIERANKTDFGLAAGVFTQDIQKAHRVVANLQAGMCWINNYNVSPVEIPFGGYKASGMGRENGLAAIEHYSQLKTVYVEMNEVQSPF